MENQSWTTIKLNQGERIDDLQRCGYKIIQNPAMFCFGMDAVLLSGYVKAYERDNVLDIGCGNGIIPLLLAGKTRGRHFTGIEIQHESADLARRSVEANNLTDRIDIVEGDIKNYKELFKASSFDVITSNPPYMINAHGIQNPDSAKAIARHEIKCDFTDIARAAAYLLKSGGRFYLVHRPFRLAELITQLKEFRLEPKRMKLVYPYIDHEPNMVLIEAQLDAKPNLIVDKPLIVYKEKNEYTDEIYDIYGY